MRSIQIILFVFSLDLLAISWGIRQVRQELAQLSVSCDDIKSKQKPLTPSRKENIHA